MLNKLLFFLILLLVFIILYKSFTYYKYTQKPIVKYKVHNSIIDFDFKNITESIISGSNWNKKFNLKKENITPDINIYLSADKDLEIYHNKKEYHSDGEPIRFSITTQNKNIKPNIYINHKNWENESHSGLLKDNYRKYIINHELGHALGYDHMECNEKTVKNNKCPVMYQSTRGCKNYDCGYYVTDDDFNGLLIDKKYNYLYNNLL